MAKVTVQVAKKVTRKKAVTKKTPAKKTPAKKVSKRAKQSPKRVAKSNATSKVSPSSKRTARAKAATVTSAPTAGRVAIGGGAKYALNGLPWVLAVGLGSLLFFKSREGVGAQAPIAPIPGLEPVSPAPVPTPKPSAPDLSPQERVDLDFRRARVAEIPRDILQKAKRHINEPIGAIIFETSTLNGKEYAFVLEQHANLKPGDGGVSVYIHR